MVAKDVVVILQGLDLDYQLQVGHQNLIGGGTKVERIVIVEYLFLHLKVKIGRKVFIIWSRCE